MSMSAWYYIFIPVVGVFGLAVTHIGLLRLYPVLRPYPAFAIAFLLWLAVEITSDFVFALVTYDYSWLDYGLGNFLLYFMLAYCYFHFFNLGETGRRMRLIFELFSASEGLTRIELAERYGSKEIMDRRIQRLLDDGQIVEQDGRFFASGPAMSAIASVIVALKTIVIGSGKAGHDG